MVNTQHPAVARVGRALAVLVAAAVVIFVVGLVAGLIFVGRHGGGPIQGWDDTVNRWYVTHRGSLVGVSKVIATWLDAGPLAIICVVLTAIGAVTLRSMRALIPIVAYLGGEFQVFVIRQIISRHRPPTAAFPAPGAVRGVHETSYSYPSGHAVAVTAVLFALLGAVALARRVTWPCLLALLASLFVVNSRLVLGVHWFSDVTFGFGLGLIWGIVVARVAYQVEWRDVTTMLTRRA